MLDKVIIICSKFENDSDRKGKEGEGCVLEQKEEAK